MKLKHTISLIGVVAVAGTSVCLSLPSCSGPTYDTKWIAHRGAPGGDGTQQNTHFENIVESYEHAGLQNFWGLETDVYKTSDNQWVVVHDDKPFYNTIPDGDGVYQRNNDKFVDEITFNDAMTSNIMPSANYPAFINDNKSPCHHLNSFSDYLHVCKMYNKEAIIEIKEPSHLQDDYPKTSDTGYLLHGSTNEMPTLWNQIENAGMKDNCVIISFQQCYIRWFAQNHAELNAEHRLQMLVDNYVDPSYSDNNTPYQDLVNGSWHGEGIKYDVSLAGDETAYLNTSYPHLSITKDMIDYTHANGRKFAIWTVDIQSHANDYMRWGVDYITTDYWKLVNSINDLPPAINWQ